jgi:hypothetical protein
MRNWCVTLAAAACLAMLTAGTGLSSAQAAPGAAQRAAGSGGSWGKAMAVPGLRQLNTGALASVDEVSCPAPHDCVAVGQYTTAAETYQGFVASERNGRWGKAIEVPGLGQLNAGGYASVDSLSCAAPGDCSAGGQYTDSHGKYQAFVVTEAHGAWGKAIEVPGSARLDVSGGADVGTMACTRPGDCSAGGEYGVNGPSEGAQQALVVTEKDGVWGKAIELPGSGRLDVLGQGEVDSLSCAAPGDCSAGGSYYDANGNYQAFVATQRNGRWGKAIEVPGTAKLNVGGGAGVNSVSCAKPGDCSAGGSYTPAKGLGAAFVVAEVNGRWGKAIEVPGSAKISPGGGAEVNSVSCAKPGYCSAGGDYFDARSKDQAFVVTEWRGRWGLAIEVRGSGRLNAGGLAQVVAVSCAAPGDCSAGGTYTDKRGNTQAFLVSEHDRWGTAIEVPGTARLNIGGYAEINSVSCAAPGRCTAGGDYASSKDGLSSQAFIVTEK